MLSWPPRESMPPVPASPAVFLKIVESRDAEQAAVGSLGAAEVGDAAAVARRACCCRPGVCSMISVPSQFAIPPPLPAPAARGHAHVVELDARR